MPSCTQCSAQFEITQDDLAFLEKVSPVFNGKKELIPPPTLCPDCRMQRRHMFRNERNLYHRKSDLTGKQIVAAYSSDKDVVVYTSDEWWSDAWDGRKLGMDFDFSRSFSVQFAALKKNAPMMALVTSVDAEQYNCSYINYAGNSKNCYMTFDSDFNEDSMYTKVLKHSKCCMDCSFVHKSELCYECVDCYDSYRLAYSENCSNCNFGFFLKNCIGCSNCLFCSNLAQKEFCIYNKQYGKEEYEKILASLELTKHSRLEQMLREFRAFCLQYPQKFVHALKAEDCSGDYIGNAQRCFHCFDVEEAQDLRFCDALYRSKDCCDVSSFGEDIELIYEAGTIGLGCKNVLFSFHCVLNNYDLLYCDSCSNCHHCFGCISLNRGKYCIFNKQYSKVEYEEIVPRIIEHMRKTPLCLPDGSYAGQEWGEFFPHALSPFGYNETVAMEYFPLTKEEAVAKGWQWHDEDRTEEQYLGPPIAVPDAIADIPDDVTKLILRCEVTGKPYKIIPQELKFYRDMGIPIPCKCPDQRHKERMALRNPRKLWQRECQKCGKGIETTYSPDRSEIVYCEECYLASVY